HLAAGKLKAAAVHGDLDALASFLQRPIAEPHDVKPGEPVGDIRLHLDPDAVEAKDRPRQGPCQHRGRYYTILCICVGLFRGSPTQRRTLPGDRRDVQLKPAAARSLGWLSSLPFRLTPRRLLRPRLLGTGRAP